MKILITVVLFFNSVIFAQTVQDSTLQRNLLERLAIDQEVRRVHAIEKMQKGLTIEPSDIRAMNKVDSINTAWLKPIVQQRGWLGLDLVGVDGDDAAFILVQHADRDTAFQVYCLRLLQRAFEIGQTKGQNLAFLKDRVELAAGRSQVYGTQSIIKEGKVFFVPIIDSNSVDQRRALLGLSSLNDYKKVLESMYTSQSKNK
ncbi:MAG: hypothetical protein Q8L01_03665 [Candidatus Woesebacteria bacterium]|nr:hypothetical protein [Candidatus Woesebacteria bacterium]